MKNRKSSKKKEEPLFSRFAHVVEAPLPGAMANSCRSLAGFGVAMLAVSLGLFLFPTFRFMAPFGTVISLSMIVLAYVRKREMVVKGYREELFQVYDYTYLVPGSRSKPTGLALIRRGEDNSSELFHIAATGKNIPPLDWYIKVYVPKDAVVTEYGGRKHFSSVFAYSVEGRELTSGDEEE